MVMAEESIGFTPAGRAPAVAGSGQPPSASASTSTTSVTTAVATNKSSATSPTSQTLSQAPPSTHNNHNNPKNDDADAQENQADSPPINLHSHRQNPNLSKLSGLRSADRSSVYLSHHHHQRVVSQISVSPNPAPDSGGASPLNPVAEDGPHAIATTHQASAFAAASSNSHRPSSPSPGASNGVITSSPHSVVRQDHLKRSATYPQASSATDNVDNQYSPSTADLASPPGRRAPASRSSFGVATTDGPPPTLRTQRAQAAEGSSSAATTPETLSPRDSRDSRDSQGQRELLLLKSLSNSSPPDEKRASTHRPPVSYKPPASASAQNATSTPVRVPPIRSFRSSGSRKSLTLDMNYKGRPYDMDDDPSDPNYDRTLRALEGRQIQDMLQQMTPPTSARQDGFDPDDGGDVFLKIAREEGAARRNANESHPDEAQSSVSRVYRSHRRPLSTNVATYQPKSPPFISRRLSDQQERSRSRHDDDRASEVTRSMTQRAYTRNHKAASVHPGDDLYRSRTTSAALRPSPLTPRSLAFQDPGSDNPIHSRRRSSITDQNSTPPVRTSTYKSGSGQAHGKSYNSSPLVRSFDLQGHHHQDGGHGLEGTESTASTTAPSTVWDELDDLKSRINRLELTGKLPSTSAAAVSRLSDERPPTATTTVTTMSSSPKRSGGGAQQNDTTSTTSSQKEAYPILHSALSKSKPFLSQDIYRALEAAANDAMALSSMMGQPGQPGPISSGASAIGSGATVTDRQLRRKADSVCRSLTELCVALGEDVAHARPAQSGHSQKASQGQSYTQSQPQPQPQYHPSSQTDGPSTPTIGKSFGGLHSRRPSVVADNLPKPSTSPNRTLSKFEERRSTILNGSSLPSPRATGSNPSTPQETTANRRSSLLISRTRRAVTEEPEETSGRRSSLLLRSRRGGTEEPEEGRQTSMLRSRRGTIGEGDDEPRFNAPSRAYTEVNATRGSTREYTEVAASSRAPTREYASQSQAPAQDPPSNPPSALPRRRFVSTNTNGSRLATPSTPSALPTRSYLERSGPAPVQERDATSLAEKPSDGRPQRYYSLGQNMSLNRTGSLSTRRQNRDSTITNAATTSTAGGYR